MLPYLVLETMDLYMLCHSVTAAAVEITEFTFERAFLTGAVHLLV